jgi:crotonobetainyl-CoA:carnitine CoA-transferase CaiB-like acyl-CoA transferase
MLEAMTEWMTYPLYYAYNGATPPPRAGAAHATIYPYGPFATGDGKTVMLGLQNEREWVNFCAQVLQQPALASDARFNANAKRTAARAELKALIEQAFGGLTAAEVVARLDTAGIANAQVNAMADVWAHPQLQARGRWTEVATPAGPVPALLPPGCTSARMDAVPALGQHTRQVLGGLGYSAEQIDALARQGAI